MKRRDWLIIAIVVVASLALLLLRPKTDTTQTAAAWLRITAPGQTFQLVPLTGPQEIVIDQADGSHNVVEVFQGGFRMKESNCKNHDCIHQGDVTLTNLDTRALANQIICLPHKVVLELVTGDEKTLELNR